MMIDFKNDEDKSVWKLSTLGLFFIKSIYTDMMNDHEFFFSGNISGNYKGTIEEQDLYVVLLNKVIHTIDNLTKRNWHG
jgi:hypothetical protein